MNKNQRHRRMKAKRRARREGFRLYLEWLEKDDAFRQTVRDDVVNLLADRFENNLRTTRSAWDPIQ